MINKRIFLGTSTAVVLAIVVLQLLLRHSALGGNSVIGHFIAILLTVLALPMRLFVLLRLGESGSWSLPVSYSTARRTHEIGIRMALGAQTGATMRTILRQGFVLALIGLGIGLPLAFLLALVIRSLLFDVNPADPITFLGGAMLVIAVALLAGYFPARQAMKIDPMKALRTE